MYSTGRRTVAWAGGQCAPAYGLLLVLAVLVTGPVWFAVRTAASNEDPRTPSFHDHAARGDVAAVERELARGTPVDVAERGSGRTPLMCAAYNGRLKVAQLLLSRGASPRWTTPAYGTALSMAAMSGGPDMVGLLLRNGADANGCSTTGVSPLMVAAEYGQGPSVAVLIDDGARVNDASRCGRTALIAAASGGYEDVVHQLMAAGADVDARDRDGMDAADGAAECGHPAVAAMLARHTVALAY